jgi:pyruvate, orthophosphate dikinase
MINSRALQINLARTQVDVPIDPRYACLQEIMAPYYGLLQGLNLFLKEVSHPYRNWQFIVDGARGYALDYFHLMKSHPLGVAAAERLIEILTDTLQAECPPSVKIDAADNLMLFLQKIVRTAGSDIDRFVPLIDRTSAVIEQQPDEVFILSVRSFYPLKRLAADCLERLDGRIGETTALVRLLLRAQKTSLQYWLGVKDPWQWFLSEAGDQAASKVLEAIFAPVCHATLIHLSERLDTLRDAVELGDGAAVRELIAMPFHSDIVQAYRAIPPQLLEAGGSKGPQWKVIFLFHAMNIDGLALLHEDTLRDINRTLDRLIADQSGRYIRDLIGKTFTILETNMRQFPTTALNGVLGMGRGIYATKNNELIEFFNDAVIRLGFQAPLISGIGNDWQIKANSAHLQNIRTWLELIELDPKRSTRLLSNLIIHLTLSGVFIRDTDIFGRDVTKLLNSRIGPVYNLTKQLARLFPVYFNDIGAEGELRDISTRIDEICHRRDPLIHFLRKQSHVESSNRVLNFMLAALHFWATLDKNGLRPYLPPHIFDQIETRGPYIDGVHSVIAALMQQGLALPGDFLERSQDELAQMISRVEGIDPVDGERVVLFAEFFKLLNAKYNLAFAQIEPYIAQLGAEAFPGLEELKAALHAPSLKTRIDRLLEFLERLKVIILSPESYEIREDIYKKRHFTVDIPSMYGSYREPKFDAMGLTLRLEALVNVLLENLIQTMDLSLITKATCYQIYERLVLFDKALKVDGIASAELQHQLELLAQSMEIRGFSFTQYLDIYKGFAQAIKNIINDHFNNIHGENLTRILSETQCAHILPKYAPPDGCDDREKLCHRTSEIFFRDRLSTSLGLQQLDLFLSRILNTLFNQSNRLPREKLRRLLNYDPQRAIISLQNPHSVDLGLIDLGNKGLNMAKLKQFNLPVPPGFIITTEVFRCRDIIDAFGPARDNFNDQVAQHLRELESLTGKHLGDPSSPLLLSMRSGSSISQPGMMDTFLNVGINEAIAHGMGAKSGNTWFAWDSYRRFLQCYGMALGLKRDDFDAIISEFKARLGIPLKSSFSGQQMRQMALAYKALILDHGFVIPEAPLEQLFSTIRMVMDSWESTKAKAYRQIMGISDDWGTAVTVQSMVFGNLSQHSGTGVIFTHNPRWAGDSLSLWGDFSIENQGEDVVSGLVRTLPISLKQQEHELRETDITLETHFPRIYETMRNWARRLVFEKGWSPQEMEFTFESPASEDLFLLQTRDMAIRERKQVLAFDPDHKTQHLYLGHGIGVSGGALSGRLVFSLEEVELWRSTEPGTALILVRGDTVPDDIQEIFATDGLLTARGGVTSHAAVVAHRLGKTCVVGCADLVCDEKNRTVTFAQRQLRTGEHISIDGREGSVFHGALRIKSA